MSRLKTYFEEIFFMDERHQPQYCSICLDCRRSCKQSFRAEVIRCRRYEPAFVPKKKGTPKGSKAAATQDAA